MKIKIPTALASKLKKRGAFTDKKLRATKAQLLKTCSEYGYTAHPSVVAFEEAFGGMLIPDEGTKLKKNEPVWIFGTHACLTVGGHEDPRGGSKSRKLVPVVYSPNDIIYFLDEQGRGYAEDTIEDERAHRFSDDGISLVSRILEEEEKFMQSSTSGASHSKIKDKISTSLSLRRSPITELPADLADHKHLTELILSECENLDVDKALLVIAKLPKLKELSLPLSRSLTSLAPLVQLPLKYLELNGIYMKHPDRLPAGIGQLKKLTDLRIRYADDIALLPEAPEDIRALRLIFAKKFTDEDIRESIKKQPEVLYLQAFGKTL